MLFLDHDIDRSLIGGGGNSFTRGCDFQMEYPMAVSLMVPKSANKCHSVLLIKMTFKQVKTTVELSFVQPCDIYVWARWLFFM